jgi:hypothetical protein
LPSARKLVGLVQVFMPQVKRAVQGEPVAVHRGIVVGENLLFFVAA